MTNDTTISFPLISNGFALATAANRIGRLTPTVLPVGDPSHANMPSLREQFNAQGYLWLKHFFDAADVLAMRKRFYELMLPTGIVDEGAPLTDGICSGKKDVTGLSTKLLMAFIRVAAYESFCYHPRLWQFYEAFLGGDVYLHKRKLVRNSEPNDANTTGAHYDLVYLRGGTDSVCTSWIPLGDCPVEMGGLIYLEGSAQAGQKMEAEFAAQNTHLNAQERVSAYNKNMTQSGWITKDVNAIADKFDARWLLADYEAGDMVVHGAYMIHASTQNVDPRRRMRLSTDIRYQRIRDEIDVRWANHWTLGDML